LSTLRSAQDTSVVAVAQVDDGRVSLARRIWDARLAYAFIAPTIGMLLLFAYYPALSAFYHSLFEWDGFTKPTFVGFDNFINMYHSPDMRAAVGNVLQLAAFAVITSITVPLLVAKLILKLPGQRLQYGYRVVFIIPLIITQ